MQLPTESGEVELSCQRVVLLVQNSRPTSSLVMEASCEWAFGYTPGSCDDTDA